MLTFLLISLAFKSFTSATSSPVISHYASKKEADNIILEENKARCDIFKYFKFSETEQLGMVRFLFYLVFACAACPISLCVLLTSDSTSMVIFFIE